jgi:oligoendopeptidase F
MPKKRSEINRKYKWNIKDMYNGEQAWQSDFDNALKLAKDFEKYAGKLSESPSTLLKAFRAVDKVWQTAEKVFVYARMRRDEDNSASKYQKLCDLSQGMISKVSASLSFFTPEFLAIPEKKIRAFIKEEPALAKYDYAIRVSLRQKKHVLKKDNERILAQLSEPLGSTSEVFTMLNNADLKFGNIKGEKGAKTEVTHGNYITLMESKDRKVRKAAYDAMYGAYGAHINTLATNYGFNTKADAALAGIRNYKSSLERALSPDNVSVSVYDNLISVVNDNLGALHRYMELRKKILKLPKLKMYDVYVPLFSLKNDKLPFAKGVELMKKGLLPLGETYIAAMSEGIESGWIDVYENEGKTSGAYSFGSYDSMPYILMNYNDRLKDVFTLVHEMGHSMHSYFTRRAQPFRYGSHSIFTAEVASTVNESLLIHYLLDTMTSKPEQKYLVNLHLEEFRTTLFRQTMFAEFEKLTHEACEGGEALTAEFLCDSYGKLNEKYFGSSVETDENIRMEWARIPHFYRAFYVYKYATGYSAATAISDRILNGGKKEQSDYIRFLKSGESDDPIELLKIAGVDMAAPAPVENAMQVFTALVDQLEELL